MATFSTLQRSNKMWKVGGKGPHAFIGHIDYFMYSLSSVYLGSLILDLTTYARVLRVRAVAGKVRTIPAMLSIVSQSFTCTQNQMNITVGVLALQGAFTEHINLLERAADFIAEDHSNNQIRFTFPEVRNAKQLSQCDALIIPGGESTTMSLVAARSGLLEPLRDFVK